MTLKYSLSHLMLLFVIVGLICLWNIQRQKIDSLTENLNHTNLILTNIAKDTQAYYEGMKHFLEDLRHDSHYTDLSPATRVQYLSAYGDVEGLKRQAAVTQQMLSQVAQ